jgi:hypothetical protein
VNWAWEREFEFGAAGGGLGFYAGTQAAVLLLGGTRLALFPPRSDTVRVASIVTPYALNDYAFPSYGGSWESFRRASAGVQGEVLDLSRQAADAGARIVFWREGAVIILEEDEGAFVEACRELARENGVYLGASLGSIARAFPREGGENKIVTRKSAMRSPGCVRPAWLSWPAGRFSAPGAAVRRRRSVCHKVATTNLSSSLWRGTIMLDSKRRLWYTAFKIC